MGTEYKIMVGSNCNGCNCGCGCCVHKITDGIVVKVYCANDAETIDGYRYEVKKMPDGRCCIVRREVTSVQIGGVSQKDIYGSEEILMCVP